MKKYLELKMMESFKRLEIDTSAKNRQLELLRANLARLEYPDYPHRKERLVRSLGDLAITDGALELPDGAWTVNAHRNRKDIEAAPDAQSVDRLLAQGLQLDSSGRPLHPWFNEMISDPEIGVLTGKGAYWKWGPNQTVDPIVLHKGRILLVERGDTGAWALPGGFIDESEAAETAGPREVLEETGIVLPESINPRLVYEGPVADVRTTANAWCETSALLYVVDEREVLGEPLGGDDARSAAWVDIDRVTTDGLLYGSHSFLVNRALERKETG